LSYKNRYQTISGDLKVAIDLESWLLRLEAAVQRAVDLEEGKEYKKKLEWVTHNR
jgi:hypothetical protein